MSFHSSMARHFYGDAAVTHVWKAGGSRAHGGKREWLTFVWPKQQTSYFGYSLNLFPKKKEKKNNNKKNPSEGGNPCKSKKGLSPKLNTDQTQSPDVGQWLYTALLNHALTLHHIYI